MNFSMVSLLLAALGAGESPFSPHVRVLDLDGDGARDLLAQSEGGRLEISMSIGPRRFLPVLQELPRVDLVDVLVADLDGGGALDLLLITRGGVLALRGEGGGRFVEATRELGLEDAGRGLGAELVDLDGDHLADLLLTNVEGQVIFWAEPGGGFCRAQETPAHVPALAAPSHVLGTDFGSPSMPGQVAGPAPTFQSYGPNRSFGSISAGSTGSQQATGSWISFLDARFVNDDAGEVGGSDIEPFSLSGPQVSTSSGDVSFLNGRVGIGLSAPLARHHVEQGPQWSSWNYGANVLVSGTRNNAVGFLDSGSTSAYAIANSGGELTFSSMPPLGDTATPPQRRFLLNPTGARIYGELSPTEGIRFADGSLLTSATGSQGAPGPQGPQGPAGPAGGLVLQFQGEGEPDVPPSAVGALWIDTYGLDDSSYWSVYLGLGTTSVDLWYELL